jgi:F-type H+-transporting ATPase subunit delta
MSNPKLAGRYAKALIDFAIERGQLEEVYNDIVYLISAFKSNKELVNFLNNPVITNDQKLQVVRALDSKRTGEITKSFNRLLIRKHREKYMPEIAESFVEQYKKHKGIYTVTLTTAIPASDEVKNAIISRIKRDGKMEIVELLCVVQESIIGGFILEGNGKRIDASVAYDLVKIKNRFLTNEFIYRFR